MCWTCICIAGPLKRCWQMKTSSKILIAGALTALVGRNFGRSSRNGSGTFAWNLESACPPLRCVPPNLLRLLSVSPHQPVSPRQPVKLYQPVKLCQLWPMVLLNGPASPLPEVFPVQLLHRNRMEACSALPIILSPHKNADPSAMGRCGWGMPLALVIVATALCGRSVKPPFSRSNPGESVPFSGRSRRARCEGMHPFSDPLNHPHFLQCYGAIGPVVTSGVTGSV